MKKILLFNFIINFLFSQYTYTLEDINPNSSTNGDYLSPASFSNQVTLHYFGHQN